MMAGTITRIPLFPLGVVLFPTSKVPLHIFEERYKKLCEESLKNHSTFGINYIEEDKLHSIGCTAQVADVIKRYPDGKLDIPHHASYWLRDEQRQLTKNFMHICWDGCMFPNDVMMRQDTWNNILRAMIAVRDQHGWSALG